jgi:integrase
LNGAIARVKDAHPHQGRHTVATEMVSCGMDPLLALEITRHQSEKSFERYRGSSRDTRKIVQDASETLSGHSLQDFEFRVPVAL